MAADHTEKETALMVRLRGEYAKGSAACSFRWGVEMPFTAIG